MADGPEEQYSDFNRQVGLALSPYQLLEEQLKLYIAIAHFRIQVLLRGQIPFRYSSTDYDNQPLEWLIKMFKRHCDNDKLIERLNAARGKRNYVAHNAISHYVQHLEKNPTLAQSILEGLKEVEAEGNTLVEELWKKLEKLKAASSALPPLPPLPRPTSEQ